MPNWDEICESIEERKNRERDKIEKDAVEFYKKGFGKGIVYIEILHQWGIGFFPIVYELYKRFGPNPPSDSEMQEILRKEKEEKENNDENKQQ